MTVDEPARAAAEVDPTDQGGAFGSAMVWSFAQTIGTQLVTLGVSFALARIMGPEVFGLIALALVYILFIQMLLQQGLTPAIIQQRNQTAEHLDTAFVMVMGATIVLSLATVAVAPLWADLQDEPQLAWVTIALAALVPIRGLIVVQDALLRRQMDFRSLAKRHLAAVVAGGVVGIVMAVLDYGVWALVGQQLANALVDVVMLWRFSSWRPRLRFSRPAARELWRYSVGASAASIAVYIATWADVVVMGFFFGKLAIGLYRFAGRLVQLLYTTISSPFLQVSLPELARHQHDRTLFGERVVELVRFSAVVSFPLFAALAAGSDDILALAGDKWAPASTSLAVLCAVMGLNSLSHFSTTILQSLGRVRLLALMHWTDAVLAVGALVVAGALLRDHSIEDQLLGSAITVGINASVTAFLMSLPVMVFIGGAPLRRLAAAPVVPLLVSVGAYGCGRAARSLPMAEDLPAILRLGVAGGTTVLVAAVATLALMPRIRVLAVDQLAGLRARLAG